MQIMEAARTEASAMRMEAEGHHGTAAALYRMAGDQWRQLRQRADVLDAEGWQHAQTRLEECIEARRRCEWEMGEKQGLEIKMNEGLRWIAALPRFSPIRLTSDIHKPTRETEAWKS